MEYPAGPDTYSYVEAGDLKLDRRLEHQGHFTFPLSHYHGITIGFTLPLAAQSLKEWMRDFPVDLVRLQEKFCAGRHPRVIHGAPSVDHIFQELYAVPEQIKQPYFRIKVLELLLYLDALELDGRTERPYFYKSRVEKVKAAHRLLTEDLERHYTIAELSERFSIPATALKECFKSVLRPTVSIPTCGISAWTGPPCFSGWSPRPAWRRSPGGWGTTVPVNSPPCLRKPKENAAGIPAGGPVNVFVQTGPNRRAGADRRKISIYNRCS